MKIGILASSGGSVFIELKQILDKCYPSKFVFFVITDRQCGIEDYCLKNNIAFKRINYINKLTFSIELRKYVDEIGGADFFLLFFLRILTIEFYGKYLCLNIHPALLPSYPGLNAVEQAINSGAKFLGSTIHLIDSGIDTGKIVGQIINPIKNNISLDEANKISFLQKLFLSIAIISIIQKGYIEFNVDNSNFEFTQEINNLVNANPSIHDDLLIEAFKNIQYKFNTVII